MLRNSAFKMIGFVGALAVSLSLPLSAFASSTSEMVDISTTYADELCEYFIQPGPPDTRLMADSGQTSGIPAGADSSEANLAGSYYGCEFIQPGPPDTR